jgi:hypothetical protein
VSFAKTLTNHGHWTPLCERYANSPDIIIFGVMLTARN